jgi:hypothetical protein
MSFFDHPGPEALTGHIISFGGTNATGLSGLAGHR